MPPKKRPNKSLSNVAEIIETKKVPVTSLKPHPRNPRIGDVESIKESLKENGQFKASVVVNRRNGLMVAGHHTKIAAQELGWTHLIASFIDVDEATHVRLMLADNKTGMGGSFDEKMLADLLKEAQSTTEGLSGTGYNELDVEDLLTRTSADIGAMVDDIEYQQDYARQAEEQEEYEQSFEGSALGEEPEPADERPTRGVPTGKHEEEEEEPTGPNVMDADESLGGIMQLKPPDEINFGKGIGYFGIPQLKANRVPKMSDLPEKLDSWYGSISRKSEANGDPDQHWFWNWGIESTTGMKHIENIIVSFFAFDDYFENWWWYPQKYASKLINSGIKMALTPDWSMEGHMPRAECLWQLYRARYIGRYLQESGLQVIPNVSWIDGDMDWLDNYVLATLPKELPMIALQMQTIDFDKTAGGRQGYIDVHSHVFDVLRPKGALIYASPQGREVLAEVDTHGTEVRTVRTRLEVWNEEQKINPRKKKEGTL